jgi:hypothetical protein
MNDTRDVLQDILSRTNAKRDGDGWRCAAIWRGSNDPNIAIKQADAPGGCVWFDHVEQEGGHGLQLAALLGIAVAPGPPVKFASASEWCAHRSLRWGFIVDVFGARGTKAAIMFPTPAGVDRMRRLNPTGPQSKVQWATKGGGACAYGLEQSRELLTAGGVLYVVNGEPSVWAAVQSGVPAVCFCSSEGSPPKGDVLSEIAAMRVPVRVVYDVDDTGRKGAAALVTALARLGVDARPLDLSTWAGWEGMPPKGADVDDLHRRTGDGGLAAALADLGELGPATAPVDAAGEFRLTNPTGEGRPEAWAGEDLAYLGPRVYAELAKRPDLYLYGDPGELVTVRNGHDAPAPFEAARGETGTAAVRIRPVDLPAATFLLSQAFRWVREGRDGDKVAAQPGRNIQAHVASLPDESGAERVFRRLNGTAAAPYVTGSPLSVHSAPGYHVTTGVWLADHKLTVDVPKAPTQADAIAARETLLELVSEVPFIDDVDRAVYLSAMLTPPALAAFGGALPSFIFEADAPGAGKSRLARLIVQVWTGTELAIKTYTPDDEEMQKRLVASARAGESVIVWDNVKGRLGGGALEAAATAGRLNGRVLGASDNVNLPFRPLVIYTVNHAQTTPDMAQRCLRLRLSHDGLIAERRDFKIADLSEHLRQHRGRYVSAALTMLLAYDAAGRPPVRDKGWRDFREFADLVMSAVVWADMPDPYQNTAELMHEGASGGQALADLSHLMSGAWSVRELNARTQGFTSPHAIDFDLAVKALTDYEGASETQIRAALLCLVKRPFTRPDGERVMLSTSNRRGSVVFQWVPLGK